MREKNSSDNTEHQRTLSVRASILLRFEADKKDAVNWKFASIQSERECASNFLSNILSSNKFQLLLIPVFKNAVRSKYIDIFEGAVVELGAQNTLYKYVPEKDSELSAIYCDVTAGVSNYQIHEVEYYYVIDPYIAYDSREYTTRGVDRYSYKVLSEILRGALHGDVSSYIDNTIDSYNLIEKFNGGYNTLATVSFLHTAASWDSGYGQEIYLFPTKATYKIYPDDNSSYFSCSIPCRSLIEARNDVIRSAVFSGGVRNRFLSYFGSFSNDRSYSEFVKFAFNKSRSVDYRNFCNMCIEKVEKVHYVNYNDIKSLYHILTDSGAGYNQLNSMRNRKGNLTDVSNTGAFLFDMNGNKLH